MITDDLKRVELTDSDRVLMSNVSDFNLLGSMLAECKEPEEAVILLKAELEGRNRYSYIARIYGRYRKLLPVRDLEAIQRWNTWENRQTS